jgi:hypothetical protein
MRRVHQQNRCISNNAKTETDGTTIHGGGAFAAAINSTITYFNTKSFMISLLVIYKHHHHDKKSYVDTGDDAKFCPARASHANGLSDKAKATTRPKHFTVLQDDEETTMSFGNSFNGGRTRMVRVFDPM